jgi:type II secretory pathway predicted ATPase ExeA
MLVDGINKPKIAKPKHSQKTAKRNPTNLGSFGLQENPFSNKTDEKYFFSFPALQQRYEALANMMQTHEGLTVVTGDPGIGKSTLLRRFVNQSGVKETAQNWEVVQFQGRKELRPEQLIAELTKSFKLGQIAHDESALNKILDKVRKLNQLGVLPVFIFDDAEKIPAATLEFVFKLKKHAEENRAKLAVFLFAGPEIKAVLAQPELKHFNNGWITKLYLPRLTKADTRGYIEHRLRAAGIRSKTPFTPEQIHGFHNASSGLPLQINQVANLALARLPELPDETTSFRWTDLFKPGGAVETVFMTCIIVVMIYLSNTNMAKHADDNMVNPAAAAMGQEQENDANEGPQ